MTYSVIDTCCRAKDLTGQVFGRLTAIAPVKHVPNRGYFWLCICECGTETSVVSNGLIQNNTRSCGCLLDEIAGNHTIIHGKSKTKVYEVWCGIKARCYNPKKIGYKNYGGRGIKVCDRWINSFENFYSDMGDPPDGLTLDRIDNDGDYTPENCRWASRIVQVRNRRNTRFVTLHGARMPMADAAKIIGLKYDTLKCRLNRGWPENIALSLPLGSTYERP